MIALVTGCALLGSCGGGGTAPTLTTGPAWIQITDPNATAHLALTNPVRVSGEAFVSEDWSSITPTGGDPGVTVNFQNAGTGESGTVASDVEVLAPPAAAPTLGDHTWSLWIDLASGPNEVTFTAADPGGNQASTSITIVPSDYIPSITAVTPSFGPPAGGTLVTISGTRFLSGLEVKVGFNQLATDVVVHSPFEVTARLPSSEDWRLDATSIRVTNPGGEEATFPFTYLGVPMEFDPAAAVSLDAASVENSDNLYIVWQAGEDPDGEILLARSTDRGMTWLGPATLSNSQRRSSRPCVAAYGATVLVVWEEEIGPGGDLHFFGDALVYSVSTDHGVNFSPPQELPLDPAPPRASELAYPDAAFDASGEATVIFQIRTGIHAVRKSTSGFGPNLYLGFGERPSIAAGPGGGLNAVWTAFGDIIGSESIDGGATWTTGNNLTNTRQIHESSPAISADASGALVAWLESAGSRHRVRVAAGSITGFDPLLQRGTAPLSADEHTRPSVFGGEFGYVAYDVAGEITLAGIYPDPSNIPGFPRLLRFDPTLDVTRGSAHARSPRLFAAPPILTWLDDRATPGKADVFIY